ncbi:MAG: asparagine synthase (glutamine-hydrolyzing) [Acidobacteriota bacterium]|nr:asparagine synthase (glutamine-hydrolyzing) [Acidobacteriota bacterium]MDH3783723.1 asparagine synthase (glutamine-hydrolyzing) [Acidobacteriota bacterium]
MCGICGVLERSGHVPIDRNLVEAMTDRMGHRGPDDQGLYFSDSIALGHRRLSIVDASGGRQPMSSGDGSIHIVFNGEIYNHQSLRRTLEQKGYRFSTRSDTESLLHLYEEFGDGMLEHLDGMFAFAIWDSRRRRLFLARDRLGIKPLYYSMTNQTFVFASEIKALLLHPSVSREIDPIALDGYLALQYVPTPRTIFSAVKKLPAGHLLVVEHDRVMSRRYWELNPAAAEMSIEEGRERVRSGLEASVRARLMSDVPLGVFLSGGLDSSLIAALMAQQMDRPVKSYSIGFEGGGWHSETEYAELVARSLGAEHHTHIVSAMEIGQLLGSVLEQLDEPLADPAAIPTYLLSKFAREQVTVCLTGEGADELFAGYRRYALEKSMLTVEGIPRGIRKVFGTAAARLITGRLRKPLLSIGLDQPERFVFLRSVIPASARNELLRSEVGSQVDSDHLERRMERHFVAGRGLNEILRADTQEWLADDLLMKVDKMSMMASLEARVPFLDHKLVELVAGFPASWKYRRGTSKWLLKDVARSVLPKQVIERPKHGFMPPITTWLRGDLAGTLDECLLDPQALSYSYLRAETVRSWISRFKRGDARMDLRIWIILCLEIWMRRIADRPVPGTK